MEILILKSLLFTGFYSTSVPETTFIGFKTYLLFISTTLWQKGRPPSKSDFRYAHGIKKRVVSSSFRKHVSLFGLSYGGVLKYVRHSVS